MAAGLGFKTFTTGEVLTSADVNGYLMQGVLVFASEAARDAAITSPEEGQFAFTKDNNSLWYYTGSVWVASGATGDIEGVTAGTGISGGGTSGTVTITNSMATEIDAKGDLVVGTGADTFARLAVGTNDYVLTADSGETTGLKWAAPAGGSSGPAFRAYRNGSQSITASTATKVQLNTETFDTDNCFDSTTNYRFTPTTAGYYQVNATIEASGTSSTYLGVFIYKNGSRVSANRSDLYESGRFMQSFSDLIYLNGSSDYIELYGAVVSGSSTAFNSGSDETFFSGVWIRS
jgi:hypothetical protein